MRLDRIDHVALGVSDLERSVAWYGDVLGLQPYTVESWGGEPVFVRGPDRTFGLALFHAEEGEAPVGGVRHIAFGVDRAGFAAARDGLRARGIPFRFADHEVSHSLYFRDPDGHQLEITTYEIPRP